MEAQYEYGAGLIEYGICNTYGLWGHNGVWRGTMDRHVEYDVGTYTKVWSKIVLPEYFFLTQTTASLFAVTDANFQTCPETEESTFYFFTRATQRTTPNPRH